MAVSSKNFSIDEFACKCCGKNEIDQHVINMCQAIRDRLGEPIRISSGYRCEKHNAEVGGVKNSFHAQGLAGDLHCASGAKKLFAVIADLKARGKLPDLQYAILYVGKNFVHIDSGKERSLFFEVRP